ncbi:MAG TPA: transglutaminase-like cysteine peptidase [Thauera sp.]|nr:transglutaminase-like cysteine peptidase [Thauera sp.]
MSNTFPALRRFLSSSIAQGLLILLLPFSMATLVVAGADLTRMERIAATRYGPDAAASVRDWRAMLEASIGSDDHVRLARINNFFNRRIRFDEDTRIWQQSDFWATPLETLSRAAGDCEDFAIAKYASLMLIGIPARQLRLIYVRARIGGADSKLSQAHMVVGYFPTPEAEPLILDNLIGEVRPASRRPDLTPVFSFGSDGLWVGGSRESAADPTARLSRWRDALQRMRAEGLDLAP